MRNASKPEIPISMAVSCRCALAAFELEDPLNRAGCKNAAESMFEPILDRDIDQQPRAFAEAAFETCRSLPRTGHRFARKRHATDLLRRRRSGCVCKHRTDIGPDTDTRRGGKRARYAA